MMQSVRDVKKLSTYCWKMELMSMYLVMRMKQPFMMQWLVINWK